MIGVPTTCQPSSSKGDHELTESKDVPATTSGHSFHGLVRAGLATIPVLGADNNDEREYVTVSNPIPSGGGPVRAVVAQKKDRASP